MERSSLFARLYLDEDVNVQVAEIVRGYGYEACTAREKEMLGASDEEQLAFAATRGMVLVTHNRVDFESLARQYYHEGRTHWGIVCAARRPPHDCARRLVALLNDRMAEECKNHLLYV